jgi:hypothetical protein
MRSLKCRRAISAPRPVRSGPGGFSSALLARRSQQCPRANSKLPLLQSC